MEAKLLAETPLAGMKYWPCQVGSDNRLVKFLYRAMTNDGSEMTKAHSQHEEQVMQIGIDDDRLRFHVIEAVRSGSKFRSPFMHASTDFHGARRFKDLAERLRGEDATQMVRIDLDVLNELIGLSDKIIALDTDKAQKAFFSKNPEDYGPEVASHFTTLRRSTANKEVLLLWRGKIPEECMTVIDPSDASVVGPYRDYGKFGSRYARATGKQRAHSQLSAAHSQLPVPHDIYTRRRV